MNSKNTLRIEGYYSESIYSTGKLYIDLLCLELLAEEHGAMLFKVYGIVCSVETRCSKLTRSPGFIMRVLSIIQMG